MMNVYPVKVYESNRTFYISEFEATKNKELYSKVQINYILIGLSDITQLFIHKMINQKSILTYSDLSDAISHVND